MAETDASLFDDIVVPEATAPDEPPPAQGQLVTMDEAMSSAPIRSVLPGFDLHALLTFVPDVQLKRRLDAMCEGATTLDLKTAFGLARAEGLVADLRAGVTDVESRFELACSLANQLHKRMTGLRADFTIRAVTTATALSVAILAQQRENKRVSDEDQRKRQAEADRQAKADAAAAAKVAKASGASKEVIQELKEQAKTAVAPPVPSHQTELKRTTAAANWKCRPIGTKDGEEPNPEMADATEAQLAGIKLLMTACVEGRMPMAMFEVRWPALNARASSEKQAMRVPGMEAADVGKLLSKRRPK